MQNHLSYGYTRVVGGGGGWWGLLRRRTTTCDGYILGYRGPSCDVARRLRDREASYDVLVCLVMSKNLAIISGSVGYREIIVRRRSYSYDI